MKCKICGIETRKGRQTCLGCNCIKKVAKSGVKAPKSIKTKAFQHLENKPELKYICWLSFFKKNKKTLI
jgi:hypothetical protein